jgi:hypothetical protein
MVEPLEQNNLKLNELIKKMESLCVVLENFNKKISANEKFISKFVEKYVLMSRV